MTIVWLVLSTLLARWRAWPRATGWARAVAAAVAVAGGLTLPDIDHWVPLLDHRSGVTHSILSILALAMAGRSVAAGAALGVGFHLAADCFPAAMVGFAVVRLPIVGSVGAGWSYVWLGMNSLLCTLWGAGALARDQTPGRAVGVLAAAGWLGLVYLTSDPGGWPALLLYALAGWWLWPRAARLKRTRPLA